MNKSLNIKGRVIRIDDAEKKTETFTVRQFVIETGGTYSQKIQFQLTNYYCDLIDHIKIGEEITVHFDIRGSEWNDKIINNLNAWRIDRHVNAATSVPPVAKEPVDQDGGFPEEDDLPF